MFGLLLVYISLESTVLLNFAKFIVLFFDSVRQVYRVTDHEVTVQLIDASVLATLIVQFLYFLYSKFQASSHILLSQYCGTPSAFHVIIFCGRTAQSMSDLVENHKDFLMTRLTYFTYSVSLYRGCM